MNFLQLSQRLRQEAGIAGSGPTTVISQTGELGRIVSWVLSAYEEIQNLHSTWRFLQADFSFSTVASTQNYTKTTLSLTDLGSWKTDDVRIYSAVTDETYLTYFPWDKFKELYLYGSQRTQTERPTIFSIKYDDSISLWAIPDDTYTVNGEYFKTAQTMTLDASEPLIPSAYQMAIVWKGLMLYSAYNSIPDAYAHGQNEFRGILRKLEFSQLDRMTWGDPLV